MTNNGSSSRLDRIEALIKSNARAIQALTEDLATFKLTVEQDHAEAKAEIGKKPRQSAKSYVKPRLGLPTCFHPLTAIDHSGN
ncbi:MAG: hypothetical protein JOZ78_21225 [Chroococcidiopsidaceae cyanobacterium CP_BM_ER_R8_30]|nr:hypothetical protein [Chroococcidiopsidaceae cyanobacterium CP_BM_ER_R8_30]